MAAACHMTGFGNLIGTGVALDREQSEPSLLKKLLARFCGCLVPADSAYPTGTRLRFFLCGLFAANPCAKSLVTA
jgi:hypothetical protein